MAINPAHFHAVNVADTCSVWNILSSETLHSAAKNAGCSFCITDVVRYELLIKPRSEAKASDIELRKRLVREQSLGGFPSHTCSIDDLRVVSSLEGRKKLGKGELSSIAFAMRIRQAVITDDVKAAKLARESGHDLTQTTPHLLAWLDFNGALSAPDKVAVLAQHADLNGSLAGPFQRALEMASQCKANASTTAPTQPPTAPPSP
ncbi:hypothetical protein [Pseudoduganella aquatica]|uniref:PIN domain-containing protein n=1 Tax=Pseudoduganella aquatica TaxID=2660641 RepID=A0A7X4HGU0_9BURK|nr:hypothetical protein [Pseudoduganella aquatica]MYN10493.1 hypothetical protein [Pseudoduganella aquatica]